MTKIPAFLIILVAIAIATPLPATAEDVAKGHGLVESKCSSCHALGKNDTSPMQKAPPFRDVVTRYPLESLEEALAEGIIVGHEDMPEFTLTPDEINDLLAYLKTLIS